MLTMAPPLPPWPSLRAIRAPKACVQRKAPSRLVAMTVRHSSNDVSSTGLKTATPALLTSASTRPQRAMTAVAASSTRCGSETSQCWHSSRAGQSISCAVRSSVSLSMSSSATRQPRCRNHSPMDRPMPRAPPVTTATRAGMDGNLVGSWTGSWIRGQGRRGLGKPLFEGQLEGDGRRGWLRPRRGRHAPGRWCRRPRRSGRHAASRRPGSAPRRRG